MNLYLFSIDIWQYQNGYNKEQIAFSTSLRKLDMECDISAYTPRSSILKNKGCKNPKSIFAIQIFTAPFAAILFKIILFDILEHIP